ncbi:MAG: RIP metalloprotease RseP [Deltaproteobacteria bacterium]|jgi:regulator of sigma E protease|nr:RIP metalloprotease RseP [Deltaproteobacteria bacterium]
MITTLVSFVVLLIILIFVHELGHFLAAKLLGVGVERFSLGFPPKLWSRKIGETEYQLAVLPLGGYVKLVGEEPGVELPPEDLKRSFNNKPFWVKSIVVLAGPAFNLVFAALALWLLTWAVGIQHARPVLGPLDPESPLARAGLMMDDTVTAVDGRPVSYFDELADAGRDRNGAPVRLTVLRSGMEREFEVAPVRREGTTLLGDRTEYWHFGFTARVAPVLDEPLAGKPAAEAGLMKGDLVTAVDGTPAADWSDVVRLIQRRGSPDAAVVDASGNAVPMRIDVERDGRAMGFTVIPELDPRQGLDGETSFTPVVGIVPETDIVRESVGPVTALGLGTREAFGMAGLTVMSVVKLVQRKISSKVMGGPIMIAEIAGKKAREGLADFIWLMCFISVNLCILNLLPLPVLDGGQFVIFVVEAVKRSPISLKVREVTQWVGVAALAGLMILVFYNDISRIVTRFSGPPAPSVTVGEAVPAPADPAPAAGGE